MDQWLEALELANERRLLMARFKRSIRDAGTSGGARRVMEVLEDPQDFEKKIRVIDLLKAIPAIGDSKASRIMRRAQVGSWTRVGALTEMRRRELAFQLWEWLEPYEQNKALPSRREIAA